MIFNESDIASDEIENIIERQSNLFENLKELRILDRSGCRRLFGIFLGVLKSTKNIKKLSIESQDRSINIILQESLPEMKELQEVSIDSKDSRNEERMLIVKENAKNLKKITVIEEFSGSARKVFEGTDVEICVL